MSKSVEFEVILKNGQLEQAARESEEAIRDVGSAARRTSAEMSEGWSSAGEQIAFQKKIIAELEQELGELEQALKKAVPGNQWVEAVNELNDVKRELNGEKQALAEMEGALEGAEEKHVSLRAQIRAVKEEMAEMALAGEDTTEAYAALKNRLGELIDVQGDIAAEGKELANDERSLEGVISGLTGLSGAFSAATGAVALFGGENENLQRIMLKVQSLMAITVGLQQVQQALNKDSAFMLVTVNGLKEWWAKVLGKAAAAETAETAAMSANTAAAGANATATAADATAHSASAAAATANAAATTASGAAATGAAGAFKVLGTAIKSVPVIGWIIAAISAVITVATVAIKKFKKAEKEQQEEMQRMHRQWSEFNSAVSEGAISSISSIESLSDKYKRLGDNMSAKKKFISDNAEEFRKLGLSVQSVADAENLLINNKDKFIQAQIAKATAEVYAERIKEILKQNMNLLSVDIGADAPKPFPGMKDDGKTFKPMEAGDANPVQVAAARKMWSEVSKLQDEAYRQEQKSMQLMKATGVQLADNAKAGAASIRDAVSDTKEADLPGYNLNLQKLQAERDKQIVELRRRVGESVKIGGEEVEIDSDAIEQELKIVEESYQKAADELAEKYGVSIPVKTELTAETDGQDARERYSELLEQYGSYRQKVAAINEKYDGLQKSAGTDEAMKGSIGKERDREIAQLTTDTILAGDAFKALGDDAAMAGERMRQLLETRLTKLVEYVKAHKGDLGAATDADAASLGVDAATLASLLTDDNALKTLEQHLDSIGSHNAFKDLKKGVEQLREAQRKCREDGGPIDEDMVAKAQDALVEAVKSLGGALESTASEIASSLREIGELVGSEGLEEAATLIEDVVGNLQAAEEGAEAWGGWWGAIIGGVTDLIPKVVKWVQTWSDADSQIEATYAAIESHQSRMEDPRLFDWLEHFDRTGTRDTIEGIADALARLVDETEEMGSAWDETWGELSANGYANSDAYLDGVRGLLAAARTGEYAGSEMYASFSTYCNNAVRDIADLAQAYKEEMAKAGDRTSGRHYEKAQELAQKMEELTAEYAQNMASFIEEVFGGSAESIASQLGNSLMDAFASGEDAAQAFGDTVNDIIRDMARNLLKQKLLEGPIDAIMSEYEQEYASINFKGTDGGINWWLSKLPEIYERYMDVGEDAEDALQNLPAYLKEFFSGSGSSSLSGSIKGITSDQAGMLAGQMNAMRMAQMNQVQLLTDQLASLNSIDNNTKYIEKIYRIVKSSGSNDERRAYGQN